MAVFRGEKTEESELGSLLLAEFILGSRLKT